MYFYSRKEDSRAAKARQKMRKNQIAIIDFLYEKALINKPELKSQIENQINDFRSFHSSIEMKPTSSDFDSIVYDADEEFEYLITELAKYVDRKLGQELDKTYGTNYFS
ncbi:MAG: hypothetical protein AB8G05_03355 [Oligoflexales bacterium]